VIDEVAVALEVLLVDIEPGRDPEESLEFCHAHDVAAGPLVRLHRGDHGLLRLSNIGEWDPDAASAGPIDRT
jgi:hypothetical protein